MSLDFYNFSIERMNHLSYIVYKAYDLKYVNYIEQELHYNNKLPNSCLKFSIYSKDQYITLRSETLSKNFIDPNQWISLNSSTIKESVLVSFLYSYYQNIVVGLKKGWLYPIVKKNTMLLHFDNGKFILKFLDYIRIDNFIISNAYSNAWVAKHFNKIENLESDYLERHRRSICLLIYNYIISNGKNYNRISEYFCHLIQSEISLQGIRKHSISDVIGKFEFYLRNGYWQIVDNPVMATNTNHRAKKTISPSHLSQYQLQLSKLLQSCFKSVKARKLKEYLIPINRFLITRWKLLLSIFVPLLIFSFGLSFFLKKDIKPSEIHQQTAIVYKNKSKDVMIVKNENGKYGLTTLSGLTIKDFEYDDIVMFDTESQYNLGLIFYKKGKCGVMNLSGKLLVDNCIECGFTGREYVYVKYKNKYNKIFSKIVNLNDF